MKIICDSCGTKYSIADEKVKGKVFKIRCKKCQHIIVVRGATEEAGGVADQPVATAAPSEPSGGETPIWHVVIGGEQVGPMTAQEVRSRFSSGEVNADTYTWREGFTDWVRLATVDEFADLEKGAPAASAGAAAAWDAGGAASGWGGAGSEEPGWGGQESPGFGASADPAPGFSADAAPGFSADAAPGFSADAVPGFDASASLGADPSPGFGDAASDAGVGGGFGDGGGGADLFGAQPAAAEPAHAAHAGFSAPATEEPAGGGDLFGGAGSGQQLFPDDDGAKEGGEQVQMTGQRGENSVLFSLSNLQHLAMGSKGPSPTAAAAVSPSNGSSAEVGSGLIDIRTMAASTAAATSPEAKAGDDLPVLGGFSAPVAAPVLMPAASEERPKWLMPAIFGGGGLVLVGLIVVIVLLATREPPTPPPVVAANTQVNPMAAKQGAETAAATEKTAATKEDEKKPEKEDEAKAEEPDDKKRKASRRSSRKRPRVASRKRDRSETRSAPPPTRVSNKPKRKKDSLDALIDGALGGGGSKPKPRRAAAPAAPSSNLPDTLTRSQIQGGMRRIKGRVQGCYDKFKVPGLANVQVKIGRNGKVSSARIKGIFSGTPTGACVLSAVRSARFPQFKGAPITITYPFVLR